MEFTINEHIFNKTKKHNYFNEKHDYIIRFMVDYYYTKVFQQIIQYNIKLVINSMQYVNVF